MASSSCCRFSKSGLIDSSAGWGPKHLRFVDDDEGHKFVLWEYIQRRQMITRGGGSGGRTRVPILIKMYMLKKKGDEVCSGLIES